MRQMKNLDQKTFQAIWKELILEDAGEEHVWYVL